MCARVLCHYSKAIFAMSYKCFEKEYFLSTNLQNDYRKFFCILFKCTIVLFDNMHCKKCASDLAIKMKISIQKTHDFFNS